MLFWGGTVSHKKPYVIEAILHQIMNQEVLDCHLLSNFGQITFNSGPKLLTYNVIILLF